MAQHLCHRSAHTSRGSSERTTEFLRLRLEHDGLFQKRNHSWKEFHENVLVQNGFPEELPISVIRSKWLHTCNGYKTAKDKRNKKWLYYDLFDKYYGKKSALDKYHSWNNKWRLKLIKVCHQCSSESKKNGTGAFWRAVEAELRLRNLPIECCIQDIRGLWTRLQAIFQRKYRLSIKTSKEPNDWPLYDVMLGYYQTCETDSLERMRAAQKKKKKIKTGMKTNAPAANDSGELFQWSKDITESFIQLRLQHEHIFKAKFRAWKDMHKIMMDHCYPSTLTTRMMQTKWTHIMADYQKAMATNNTNWIYYNLFQAYLGESSLNLDPLRNWRQEWVLRLIIARTKHDAFFYNSDTTNGWREVEKELRIKDFPLDHSLLDIEEIWTHLTKTYRWKRKFATKGMLNEEWPYYEAMSTYNAKRTKQDSHLPALEYINDETFDDDDETEREKEIEQERCRVCEEKREGVSLFGAADSDETMASKLRIIGGVEIEAADSLPKHICNTCVEQLEQAYQFRTKCQASDKQFRLSASILKIDLKHEENEELFYDSDDKEPLANSKTGKNNPSNNGKASSQKPKPRKKYVYNKICEICGKSTPKMSQHMKLHSEQKQYKCEYCDKTFKYKSSVSLHRVVHSGTPVKICRICGKEFYHMSYYRRHYVYHANERKFYCDVCGKSFNTKSILVQHKKVHVEDELHVCNVCGRTFKRLDCLKRHIKQSHKNNSTGMTGDCSENVNLPVNMDQVSVIIEQL